MSAVAPSQALRALQLANHIRVSRAQIRKQIHEGAVSTQDIIFRPPPAMETATVGYVLRATRGAGLKRVRTVCKAADVPETTRLGNLTANQRARLIGAMERWSCFQK